MLESTSDTRSEPPRRSPWQRFADAHLHDYNVPATRAWLAVVLLGGFALGITISQLALLTGDQPADLARIIGWTALAAVAAAFPIRIPRTKHSIATGDTVAFLLLALHGPAAATLAAGLEGLIASWRTSKRVSSRGASLAANAASMAVAGSLFVVAESQLGSLGLSVPSRLLIALALAALVYYGGSTYTLMQIIALKRSAPMTLADWFRSTSWIGTLYLVSATVAGLLALSGLRFGQSTVVVAAAIVGLGVALLRVHFHHLDVENEAQEARLGAVRREAEKSERRFSTAFAHASIGMAIVSPDGIVLQCNQMLCSLLGCDPAQLAQQPFRGWVEPADGALLDSHVRRIVAREEAAFAIELRCRGADERKVWVSLHCALFDDGGTMDAGLIFQVEDITSRRRVEELNRIAFNDSLTDLANRMSFLERLAATVDRSRSDPTYRFAMMYLDLDRFKKVNDKLGHAVGDELLKEVARRLRACVRPADMVARLGGDEFAILVDGFAAREDVIKLGERLLQAIAAPVRIDDRNLWPRASIGVTFSGPRLREPAQIMHDADAAMYQAKSRGRAHLSVFDGDGTEDRG